jgi:uncharacterized protein (TIGR04255 family)
MGKYEKLWFFGACQNDTLSFYLCAVKSSFTSSGASLSTSHRLLHNQLHMTERAMPVPLAGPPPSEVPLPRAPLARVIAQVRFPEILSIRNPDNVAAFQDALRASYPMLVQEQVASLVISPPNQAVPRVEEAKIWRFADKAVEFSWRVSLGIGYVALETTAYKSRADFLKRLSVVLKAVESNFKPAAAQRLGMRHVNRLRGEALENITALIKPSVLGILADPDEMGAATLHLLSEAQLLTSEGLLLARWGNMPANATYDPESLPPIPEPSWLMDFDMFKDEIGSFDSEALLASSTQFAERVYSVFRRMVTDEFLRFFGGEI